MYMSRLFLGVIWCGEVEKLDRSCPGFVVVSMGPLGEARVLPFAVFL